MEKILIISYFFPPCNLTASQRAYGWAKYFHEFGYYPIIITRRWDNEIKIPVDTHRKTGDEIMHEKFNNYEVYYLPYIPNLRDILYTEYKNSIFVIFRKFLSLLEQISQNFTNYLIPFNNIYIFAKKYLTENPDIDKLIITANPFILFKFGFQLNKELNINWIADYRDEWSTQQLIIKKSFIKKLIKKLESHFEKKWIKSATLITSVSEFYTSQISSFVKRDGKVILNGFFQEDYNPNVNIKLFDDFSIIYNGMLYPVQKIGIFLDAIKKLIDNAEKKQNIKIYFLGLAYEKEQYQRIIKYMENYSENIIITQRIPKEEVMEIQKKSHLLLLISYGDSKGTTPSKLYEYMSLRKPILLCPSDNNVIEKTLKQTGLGYFANTSDEVFKILNEFYDYYLKQKDIPVQPNENEINTFSRRNQAEKLAAILKNID